MYRKEWFVQQLERGGSVAGELVGLVAGALRRAVTFSVRSGTPWGRRRRPHRRHQHLVDVGRIGRERVRRKCDPFRRRCLLNGGFDLLKDLQHQLRLIALEVRLLAAAVFRRAPRWRASTPVRAPPARPDRWPRRASGAARRSARSAPCPAPARPSASPSSRARSSIVRRNEANTLA